MTTTRIRTGTLTSEGSNHAYAHLGYKINKNSGDREVQSAERHALKNITILQSYDREQRGDRL